MCEVRSLLFSWDTVKRVILVGRFYGNAALTKE
jgi:hypothetical protein